MAGFVRRFTSEPTQEVILQIEGPVIIDLAPPPPVTGAGTGTVLLFGEMEDGPLAIDPDGGPLEVFGSTDLQQKFGAFGFEYDGVVSQNPAARRHLQELWNGNGFLKLFKMRAQRLIVARVDTNVGTVSFDPLACASGNVGPYQLTNGDVLTVETDTGGPANSTNINGVPVTIAGLGSTFASILSGETVAIRIDGGPTVNVIFAATDTTAAAVATRINTALGFTSAVVNTTEVDISGIRPGNGGSVELTEVTSGLLAKLGQVEGVWEDKGLIKGTANAFASIVATENFDVTLDGGTPITVTFGGAPASLAAAVADINTQVGQTVAFVTPDDEIRFYGGSVGTGGSIELAAGAPDALTKLGHVPGSAAGISNVSDLNAVTATEVAAIVNGTAGLSGIDVTSNLGPDGSIRVCADSAGIDIVAIATTSMATAIGLTPLDTVISATDHDGGTILAGTRVRDTAGPPANEWVTMQTLDIPAGVDGPYTVKVRPALDDGTAVGATAATVDVLVDQPDFATLVVTNPSDLTVALTEPQLDNAYIAAMTATLDPKFASREANFSFASRRSDAIVREGLSNANTATSGGLLARKFISGDPLNTSIADSIINVAEFAGTLSDRLFYTTKGLKVRVPEIAALGTDGGLGFTSDGIITVRPDGPLMSVCAILPPENNPGQSTSLIEDFFEVDPFGEVLEIEAYKAWKANGIVAPRIDRQSGTVFQSGVTTSTDPGRTTIARRKMADFIQDTAAEVINPFAKQLNRQSRRDEIRGLWEGFLKGLEAEQNPNLARIVSSTVDSSINAGNTDESLAKGIFYLDTAVRTLSSLDNIVVRTEIGEGVVTSTS